MTGTTKTPTLVAASAAIRRGETTATDLVEACLARIAEREVLVEAWVRVDEAGARARAEALDDMAADGTYLGPLHGIPVGIKDIIDVAGLETRGGTEAYPVRVADCDSAAVARLREAGAVILGKTVTTAFAMGDPGPTRNPWDPTRTPGGSSSGSAAAVGDGMCLAALGSQTAGSVLRPAAFNGVVGFKPSHGGIALDGVIELASGLDHIGTFSRGIGGAWLLWQHLRTAGRVSSREVPLCPSQAPRTLWRLRQFEDLVEPPAAACMEQACAALAGAGIHIIDDELPFDIERMFEAHGQLMASEAATYHASNFAAREALYPPRIGELVETGMRIKATDYVAARRLRAKWRARLAERLNGVDALLMPSASGIAPEGLDYTGDRRFNLLASFAGLPALTLPATLHDGLPLGVQLIGADGGDDRLLAAGACCEQNLSAFDAEPPRPTTKPPL